MTITNQHSSLASDCDNYLAQRTATYEQRAQRYEACFHAIEMHGGLDDGDIVLDLGAGGTDLDYWLRTTQQWRGRYWPVDGWQGIDLNNWPGPRRPVAWTVLLEVIEHLSLNSAFNLLRAAKRWSTKGIVLSTPNALTTDVFAMDSTHLWGAYPNMLRDQGLDVLVTSLYGSPEDSLLCWWTP